MAPPTQEVRFVCAPDGVRIGYARHGSGPPLVVASCWLSHLTHDWQSPVWRHFLEDLGSIATVIRYDERGYGLSDWDVDDFSLEARIADLEAVVDAAGLERFALLAMSQGGPVSIEYAARHPERVSRLVFYGSYASARPTTEEDRELNETLQQLIKVGWARPEGTFRRVFTTSLIPSATEEQMRWVDDLQRMSTSAHNAAVARAARSEVDVTSLLPRLRVPTLVLHAARDRMIELARGRALASGIADARMVVLDSDNHIVLADEPAWSVFLGEVTRFLAPDRGHGPPVSDPDLSARELEVLGLAADALDNHQIAAKLTLSVRTVERHLQNVYTKLGVTGPTARAAAVAWLVSRH